MKRFKVIGACAVAALMLSPLSASAFRALNWLQVNPMPGGVFEVVGEPGSGPIQYWCAAGDYARQVLGVAANQRIYIVRGRGPSETTDRRSAVQFSLTKPPGDYQPSYSLSVTAVGENLRAASARFYCEPRIIDDFW